MYGQSTRTPRGPHAAVRPGNEKTETKRKDSSMAHWNSPHEWLLEKAQQWDADELYEALRSVAHRLNGGSIQGLFQSEMDADGYFDKKTKRNVKAFDVGSWGSHRWHT